MTKGQSQCQSHPIWVSSHWTLQLCHTALTIELETHNSNTRVTACNSIWRPHTTEEEIKIVASSLLRKLPLDIELMMAGAVCSVACAHPGLLTGNPEIDMCLLMQRSPKLRLSFPQNCPKIEQPDGTRIQVSPALSGCDRKHTTPKYCQPLASSLGG